MSQLKKPDASVLEALVVRAQEARIHAYCPYSGFAVGAALLAESGKIYIGANCENASLGGTICAERSALAAAVSAGERRFIALAVAAGDEPVKPCGICRQVLYEFGDMTVVGAPAVCETANGSSANGGEVYQTTLSRLLPHAFAGFDKNS